MWPLGDLDQWSPFFSHSGILWGELIYDFFPLIRIMRTFRIVSLGDNKKYWERQPWFRGIVSKWWLVFIHNKKHLGQVTSISAVIVWLCGRPPVVTTFWVPCSKTSWRTVNSTALEVNHIFLLFMTLSPRLISFWYMVEAQLVEVTSEYTRLAFW